MVFILIPPPKVLTCVPKPYTDMHSWIRKQVDDSLDALEDYPWTQNPPNLQELVIKKAASM